MIIGKVARPAIPPMEAGSYVGICVGSYYIGEQETKFQGNTRYARQVLVTFEFPSETIEMDGEQKPRQMSKTFTASVSKKSSLRRLACIMLGKSYTDEEFRLFDTDSLLGRSALIQIALNNTKEYANIAGFMSLPKGMPKPTTSSKLMCFSVDEWDDKAFEALPKWVQERIKKSTEYQSAHAPETAVDFPVVKTESAAKAVEKAVAQRPAITAQEPEEEEECPF